MDTPRASRLRQALTHRVVVADGAMGTMLQAASLTLEDFHGLEGCNEILNVTVPDVIESIHDAYFAVGVDCVESNTFGANWSNLSDYEIDDRIYELAYAGASIARRSADRAATEQQRDTWVLGSMGPGTKLPSLGHTTYAHLKTTFTQQALGLLDGGADAFLIETAQDILQAKAAINACHAAMEERGKRILIMVSVTVETTGTMLMGSEIGAALTALSALNIDSIGLNCATGPAEMSEHLRHLSKHAPIPVTCMPNAGLPVLGKNGAEYPLTPTELAAAHRQFVTEFGLGLVGGCCGTTPEHLGAVVAAVRDTSPAKRTVTVENGVASLYSHTDFHQDSSFLAIGERTNANGSKAFREAMLAENWDECVTIARSQTRDGAHVLDVCVDYVGRDGVADVTNVVSRLASASTLPLVIDSTEPDVIKAALELIGGRPVVNSVNFEDGDGPTSRYARIMPLVKEHGAAVVALTIDEEGQARTRDAKVAIATRLITDLTTRWGMSVTDIIVDTLTFPIATGQEETRRDAIETIHAIKDITTAFPGIHTTLGVSNVSFGLSPAARHVLNSVFLHEAVAAGLDSAIVHAAKIMPLKNIPDEQREAALDLIWDRRRYDDEGVMIHDPLAHFLNVFSGVDAASLNQSRAEELAALPLTERLERRIIDGDNKGLTGDLDQALSQGISALDIINDHLLAGMKVVGDLFGRGEMQLPFVLQSAETMKAAVAWLEPHMERTESAGKGTMVLATVRGDVHDIGKNLVDIILTNNGYNVINIGIKQSINAMIEAAEEHNADVIGMSGLLVKSTVVMKENLEELNSRGLARKYPVLLGGAALTRVYVEDDLDEVYDGVVRYARDAFEALRLMDSLVAIARGANSNDVDLPPLKKRRHNVVTVTQTAEEDLPERSTIAADNPIPTPPFWGTRVVKGIHLADYAAMLDERATFMGQWGLKPTRSGDGPSYEELVEHEGRPRLRAWLDRIATQDIFDPTVLYGYFPVYAEGNDVVLLHHEGPDGGSEGEPLTERMRFTFPRQRRDRHLCLADFVQSRERFFETGTPDVVAVQLVTIGDKVSEHTARMYADNQYRDYLELHGLSVQMTEALAEFWHSRVREELGFADEEPDTTDGLFSLEYRGARFSLGYPACPDMEDRRKIVRLLRARDYGVELSDELQLHPEQSTDAFVFHHPEAKYFSV
ncbi:methionine synthase [Jonesia denitrificans]|uniref:Methionine synthase n=1 Tax=Jonesia denitrificans (strain ATCC 14870 / DSM 20603 / BCRC 15368 / CIP 55.134 / JCM 11481 / NBRC 15587 / NCTC 10816 / Prevot 55134) TaxID=471856 RepID=C7R4L4_JONDD|nr:methionine synthase [Jonesia denitrificans]ACV09071.1 methionine synthase [Jonesia denitrificans DSM 20603]AVJ53331.1 methionine synthase [Jonesia denitrificans]QXB44179.1 methionine synthase [Jonesia denitrificans]SQH21222.1 Methionine synthase [Jonesia denitrificans]